MRTIARLLLVAALAVAAFLPVLADAPAAVSEKPTLVDVLAGKVVPLTLRLKDMAVGWSTFTCNDVQQAMSPWMGMRSGPNAMQPDNSLLFTRGQTFEMTGGSYLVAYQRASSPFMNSATQIQMQMQMQQVPMMDMGQNGMQEQADNDPLESFRLTPETEVKLQLLNVQVMGHMKDISAFNMQAMNAELDQAELIAHEGNSLRTLGQLAQMTRMYAGRYNGKLPPLTTIGLMLTTLRDTFGGRPGMLPRQPGADKTYQTNTTLTGHKFADFPHPEEIVLVFETKPWPDGKRGVGYLDGHTRFVTEAEWAKLKEKVN